MYRRNGILLFLLFLLLGIGRIHASSIIADPQPTARSGVEIVSGLTVTPSAPSVGQSVIASFRIRNAGDAALTFLKVGAGGRGPDCNDWTCNRYRDFPLRDGVVLQPGQTFTYSAETTFWETGDYFTQLVFQDANGTWFFDGERVDFTVGSALVVSQPLSFDTTQPAPNQLTFAAFALHNAGDSTVTLRSVGIGVRGPACAQLDWGCSDVFDFQFANNVTLAPGQTVPFDLWRPFAPTGSYFAQITMQDTAGVWRQLGDPIDFQVSPALRLPRTTPYKLGVHYHPVWNERDGTRLALAKAAGIDIVRIAVSWRLMEPLRKGVWEDAWYLPALENVIDEANGLGMQVLLMVQDVPCWASSDPQRNCSAESQAYQPTYPPQNNQDYADALRKLVQLFGPQVAAWEIWNEPNDERFWKPEPNAAAYTDLLRAAHAAIKAENRSAVVLGGSLAGADIDFLLAMYDNGAATAFDALALHPYSGTAAPDACPNLRSSYGCGVESVRAIMQHRGDAKPIWFTEFGWSAYEGAGGVGSAQHLRYMQDAVAMLDNWSYVPVATWYNLIDTNSNWGHLEFEDHMGLYRSDLSAKNSAEWLKSRVIDPATLTEKVFVPVIQR